MRINLFAGGKRSAVEPAEAASINERFQRESEDNTVYKIDLSCRQWKRESIDIVVAHLKEVSRSVRFVNLADVIAGLMTDEGLGVTELLAETFKIANLLEIDLSDNAMGPRGLVRSESLFTNSSLERLYLSNCGLPAEGMNMLNKYFSSGDGRIASTLTELVLDKNMIGVEGSKIVGEFLPTLKNLEYFSYNGCRPTEVGTKYVCDGLFNLTSGSSSSPLRRIEMEDCTFGDGEEESDAILPFSAALTKCSQLRHLNITDGGLEVGGIERLTSALTNARVRLSHLYLDGMGEVGVDGARVLADYLHSQATSLTCLSLNYNEMGDEGISILLEPFSASRNALQELSLNCNDIGSDGAAFLVRSSFPNMAKLCLEENDEIPKQHLKKKYGAAVVFDDDDDDDDEMEANEDMDTLIQAMVGAKL